jgi:hypothetical protein
MFDTDHAYGRENKKFVASAFTQCAENGFIRAGFGIYSAPMGRALKIPKTGDRASELTLPRSK